MRNVQVDNYILDAPVLDILYKLQLSTDNGKLKSIEPKGDCIWVTCPHHNNGLENKPAMTIYVGEDNKIPYGYCHCFVCDFKGPFHKFVAEFFDKSESYAKNWLISNYGVLAYQQKLQLEPICLNRTKKKQYLDPSILDNYQHWTPYLATRKLSRDICEEFNVRYDAYHRQVIFPCYDIKGNLIMLPKRNIDTKVFYLDKNVDKPIYCLDYVVKNNYTTCIICEGPIDCLTCYTYGKPAIATLGAISDSQIEQLNKSPIKVLYTMFDNDAAGKRFTEILKSRIAKRILVKEIQLPAGKKDINELSYEEFITCVNIAKNI